MEKALLDLIKSYLCYVAIQKFHTEPLIGGGSFNSSPPGSDIVENYLITPHHGTGISTPGSDNVDFKVYKFGT